MTHPSLPVIVLGGNIHPDGHARRETETQVVICEDLMEKDMIRATVDADGILFHIRPAGTEKLMTACERLPSL